MLKTLSRRRERLLRCPRLLQDSYGLGAGWHRAATCASRLGDKATYAKRNVVERCVNRLKQWRGIDTRSEKRAVNYRAMVVIASLMIWVDL